MTVLEVREAYTEFVSVLIDRFSTEEVIEEILCLRQYSASPYIDQIRKGLKDEGIFCVNMSLVDIQNICPNVTKKELDLFGVLDRNDNFLLSGRYCVPIRDIMGNVTALVGWYPDIKKYITTPTYGFSKDGQFFNISCLEQSLDGDYPKGSGAPETGIVYLVEGIFDTLALKSLGFPVLGNMGLNMSLAKTEMLSRFGKVIAISDNDKAGSGTNKYLSRVNGKGTKLVWNIKNEHVFVQLPNGVKDVDDFIKYYYCFDDLLRVQNAHYKIRLTDEE